MTEDEQIQIDELELPDELDLSDETAVVDAVAKAMGIEDVEKALESSQTVLPVDDQTDLEAAAKFNV